MARLHTLALNQRCVSPIGRRLMLHSDIIAVVLWTACRLPVDPSRRGALCAGLGVPSQFGDQLRHRQDSGPEGCRGRGTAPAAIPRPQWLQVIHPCEGACACLRKPGVRCTPVIEVGSTGRDAATAGRCRPALTRGCALARVHQLHQAAKRQKRHRLAPRRNRCAIVGGGRHGGSCTEGPQPRESPPPHGSGSSQFSFRSRQHSGTGVQTDSYRLPSGLCNSWTKVTGQRPRSPGHIWIEQMHRRDLSAE